MQPCPECNTEAATSPCMACDAFVPGVPQRAVHRLPPDENIAVTAVGLWRGNGGLIVKHGFYRKDLTPPEADLAEMLHAKWADEYGLDGSVDEAMLLVAVRAFVKGLRARPDAKGDSKEARDEQNAHVRLFKEFVESLGINRKTRTGTAEVGGALAAIDRLRKAKPVDTTAVRRE